MAKKALVTGASGGIGLELSRILAREGYDLFLVARNGSRLTEISEELSREYGINAVPVPADLSDISACERLYEITGPVEVLVNNAGFGDYGEYRLCEWSKQETMIRLNDIALAKISHMYIPDMVSRGSGKILNIASVAAFQPGPLMSVYYASKAFVLSFSQALSEELRGSGVTVSALCPGPVNTGFSTAANCEDVSVFKESSGANAADVAEYGYRSMMRGRPVAVHGLLFKSAVFVERLLPRFAIRRIVHSVQGSRMRK